MKKCVNCNAELTGRQRMYCCNACKQSIKYSVSKGETCTKCWHPMEPRPVSGGFKTTHKRGECR